MDFSRNQKLYDDYYLRQIGGGISVYQPYNQFGYGLGNIFGSLFRRAIPLLKQGANILGKQALTTGGHILDDALSGKNIKKAAKDRLKQGGKDLGRSAVRAVKRRTNAGQKGGMTVVKRRKTNKRRTTVVKRRNTSIKRKGTAKKANSSKRNLNRQHRWGPDFFN